MTELSSLAPLRQASLVFTARLLAAVRDGVMTEEITVVTGLPEHVIHSIVIYAAEAQ